MTNSLTYAAVRLSNQYWMTCIIIHVNDLLHLTVNIGVFQYDFKLRSAYCAE